MRYNQNYSCFTETFGANTGTSRGTTLTAGGSSNTFGSWVPLGTTTFDHEYFIIDFSRSSLAQDYLVNIGIDDGAGNVFIIAENLHHQSRSSGAVDNIAHSIPIPVHVPKDAELVAQVSCSSASGTQDIIYHGFSTGIHGMPGFSKCVPLFTAGTSRGPAIDPGGTPNTKVITQMVASTSEEVAAIFGTIGPNGDVSRTGASTTALLDIGVGTSSNEFWVIENFLLTWSTGSDTPFPSILPIFPVSIPAGSRIAARAQASISTAGDRTLDLCLYGLVP